MMTQVKLCSMENLCFSFPAMYSCKVCLHPGWGSKVMGRRWSVKKVREKNHIIRERSHESVPRSQGQMYLPG